MAGDRDAPADDPIADEAHRAREDADTSLLPSGDGLGPGAGETPAADVTAAPSKDGDPTPATVHPSLGTPPHRSERPEVRTSQLDGAPDEADPDED